MGRSSRVWAVYVADDHGSRFLDANMARQVPVEYTGASNIFGWEKVADHGSNVDSMDARVDPRHVIGVSTAGYRSKAIVATIGSDLWTGAVLAWTDTKGTVFTVTGYVGEKRTAAR